MALETAMFFGLLVSLGWAAKLILDRLEAIQRQQAKDSERQAVYLSYITKHARNTDPALSDDEKLLAADSLDTALECIGLSDEEAAQVFETRAQERHELKQSLKQKKDGQHDGDTV